MQERSFRVFLYDQFNEELESVEVKAECEAQVMQISRGWLMTHGSAETVQAFNDEGFPICAYIK